MARNSTMESIHGFGTQLEDPRLGTDSSKPVELCAVCRRPTELRKSGPVRSRRYDIEGAGQLCSSCGERLYPFGTSCMMGNPSLPPTAEGYLLIRSRICERLCRLSARSLTADCSSASDPGSKGGEDSHSF